MANNGNLRGGSIHAMGNACKEDYVYIDVNRILDSCRDRDCFEDVRVYLPDFGQEIIDHASTVRAKSAEIIDTCIQVSKMNFNHGFYQINMRIFVRLTFDVCVLGKQQCVEGLAVVDKSVILFGSEGSVRIFKSKISDSICCDALGHDRVQEDNLPTAVLEIIDPVVLNARIAEKCTCRPCFICGCGEIPEHICRCFGGALCDAPESVRVLLVTLGFFSVVRMERPAQFLVSATEYAVPDKECVFTDDDDPCAAFHRMAFPVERFSPPTVGEGCIDLCEKSSPCDDRPCDHYPSSCSCSSHGARGCKNG